MPGRWWFLYLLRAVSLTRYSKILEPPPDEGQLMKDRNRQSGFVIEGIMILVVSVGVGIFSALLQHEKSQSAENDRLQQRIEIIESGRANDGRVDW